MLACGPKKGIVTKKKDSKQDTKEVIVNKDTVTEKNKEVTVTDKNCERLKLARSLYGMGMKVAAVSALCQDARIFDAMIMAGTPCPYKGKIGTEATKAWEENPDDVPAGSRYMVSQREEAEQEDDETTNDPFMETESP